MSTAESIQNIIQLGGILAVLLMQWINTRKLKDVVNHTNGMKDALIKEVRESSVAKGLKQGRTERAKRARRLSAQDDKTQDS